LGGIGLNDQSERIAKAIHQFYKTLKPGGRLLFAENLDAPIHRFFREHFVRWGKNWKYMTCEELRNALSPFATVTYGTTGVLGAFGRTEWQRNCLGRLDQIVLDKLIGQAHQYLMFGVAAKELSAAKSAIS
jgi:SAM-dependent methyltransferase